MPVVPDSVHMPLLEPGYPNITSARQLPYMVQLPESRTVAASSLHSVSSRGAWPTAKSNKNTSFLFPMKAALKIQFN